MDTLTLVNTIGISPPYFSLKNIQFENEKLNATFNIELPVIYEATPICAAEAARHLAILGLSHIASKTKTTNKYYYLAYKAFFTFEGSFKHANLTQSSTLTGKSQGILLNKRTGYAKAKIFDHDQLLYGADIYYHIIPEKIFHKLYKEHYLRTDSSMANKLNQFLPLKDVQLSSTQLQTTTAPITPEWCDGHFENYPALPVSILMSTFSNTAIMLYHHITNRKNKVIIRKAAMDVENFVFANDSISITVTPYCNLDNEMTLMCVGTNKEKNKIAQLEITLQETEIPCSVVDLKSVTHI